jgi:lipoprotein signal peptidase
MSSLIRPYLIIGGGGCLFIADRFLKYAALSWWNTPHLWQGLLGWSPFLNTGIAFSLPIPAWATLIATSPILLLLAIIILRILQKKPALPPRILSVEHASPLLLLSSAVLVLAGALSNFIDRFYYQYVVDYLRLATGIINVADILITAGFLLVLFSLRAQPAASN